MHLRPFLKQLEEQDKLVRIKKEVSVEYEIANIIYTLNEKPVIFDNVKGYPFPVFGGITSDRDIIAQGLGNTKEKLLLKLVEALRHPKIPEIVEKGPCQEVVIKNPDLKKLPLLFHLPDDGGRYATATVATIKDPQTGRNVSYHRLMERGANRFTARLIKGRQTRTTYDKSTGDLEMAVCIGNSVAVSLAMCFVTAYAAYAVGLAPIIGAFAAGLVLESSHYHWFTDRGDHPIEDLLHPLVLALVPIFFVLMGMKTDLRSFVQPGVLGLAAALSVAAVIGKQACSLGVFGGGLNRVAIGLGMVPRGEVGLIFANIGIGLTIAGEFRVIAGSTYSAVVVMVIVTTMLTPPALKWSFGAFDATLQYGSVRDAGEIEVSVGH